MLEQCARLGRTLVIHWLDATRDSLGGECAAHAPIRKYMLLGCLARFRAQVESGHAIVLASLDAWNVGNGNHAGRDEGIHKVLGASSLRAEVRKRSLNEILVG